MDPHGGVGLDRRAAGHAVHLAVAPELPAHHVARVQRPHGAQGLGLLVSERLGAVPHRRLHGQHRQDLEHVVLDHVADRAGLVVEAPTVRHAEVLGHGDLDGLHVVAVPHRLEEGVGEAEVGEVLDRLLAEIVVDAEDPLLGEDLVQRRIELAGGRQVVAEGLLDHHPAVVGQAGGAERLHHGPEQRRRDRQVVHGRPRVPQRLGERLEGLGVAVVAVDVLEGARDALPGLVLDRRARLLDRAAGVVQRLVAVPLREGDAHHRHGQGTAPGHGVQSRPDLLVREIAGGPEQDQGVGGLQGGHGAHPTAAATGANRIAPRRRKEPRRCNWEWSDSAAWAPTWCAAS